MNKRAQRSWELTLGLPQLTVVVGVVAGVMVGAFYLGFFSGQSVGFEIAMERSVSQMARVPIEGKLPQGSDEDLVSDVYAKLSETDETIFEAADEEQENAQTQELGALQPIRPLEGGELPERFQAIGELAQESNQRSEREDARGQDEAVQDEAQAIQRDALSAELLDEERAVDAESGRSSAARRDETGVNKVDSGPSASADEGGTLGETLARMQNGTADPGTAQGAQDGPDTQSVSGPSVSGPADDTIARDRRPWDPTQVVQSGRFGAADAEGAANRAEGNNGSSSNETVTSARLLGQAQEAETQGRTRSFVKDFIAPGWYAQIAAPRRLQDADSLGGRVRSSGFRVVVERARVRGQEYFRVLVGPEDNREQAERLVGQLERESYITTDPFVKRVR